MTQITTKRLILVPSELAVARAELADRAQFGELLSARIPENWPPETAADALPWFLSELERDPANFGWLAWYVMRIDQVNGTRELIAGIGFKGPPGADGTVETGYSVLPQFQGQGYATEMLAGIVGWAFGQPGVTRILADTMPSNAPSMRMLSRQGFRFIGPGAEEGSQLFELLRLA